jgi:predicted NBD/HSP70 family sugar kinase
MLVPAGRWRIRHDEGTCSGILSHCVCVTVGECTCGEGQRVILHVTHQTIEGGLWQDTRCTTGKEREKRLKQQRFLLGGTHECVERQTQQSVSSESGLGKNSWLPVAATISSSLSAHNMAKM